METRAIARFVRISPRKARLVVDLIRSLDVASARDQLAVLSKRSSAIVLKLLNSAVANAEHNNKLSAANLKITRAFVDEGPTLKRWRPRAFGRAAAIRKRTSHITIVLDEKVSKAQVAEKKDVSSKNDEKTTNNQKSITRKSPKTKSQTTKKKQITKKANTKKLDNSKKE